MEGDVNCGGEYTPQHTGGVLQNRAPELYVTLLTNVAPINSIKK